MGKKATFYLVHILSVIITFIFSALAIACHFASGVEPAESEFFTFLCLAITPLLVINFLFLLYWIVRFRIWFIVSLIAIIANYSYLSSVFRFSSSENTEAKYDLKIATYNVHGFRAYKLNYTVKQIAQFFKNENVDVVCMQEFVEGRAYNLDSIKADFSYLPYCAAPKSPDSIMNMVVFSKYPITLSKLYSYHYTDNSFMTMNLDVNGKKLLLINAHLQTTNVNQSRRELAAINDIELFNEAKNTIGTFSGRIYESFSRRAEQINDIAKIIETSKIPVILCGDFNDISSSYVYNRVLKTGMKDGFKSSGEGYAYTFRPYFKLLRIDYIFHSDILSGVNYYSPDIDFSDHKPVIMKLNINVH